MVNEQTGDQAATPAPVADTFELPETPDAGALGAINDAMLEAWGPPELPEPVAEADEEADPEDELDDAADEEDEEPEPADEALPGDRNAADTGQPQGGRTVDEWVALLDQKGIQSHSQVPRKLLGDVLAKYSEHEKQRVVQDTALIAQAQLESQRRWIKWIGQVDQAYLEDPDGKLAWLESGDQHAQVYQQWKAYMDREVTPEDVSRTQSVGRFSQAMQKQVTRLQGYPDLAEQIAQKHRANPYPADIDGLDRLTDDVIELLATVSERQVAERNAPAKKAAAARKAGAETRRAVPRVDGSRTRVAAGGASNDIQNITDPAELFRIGINRAWANK